MTTIPPPDIRKAAYADASTRAVITVNAFRARLKPDSERGARASADLKPLFGDAWDAENRATRALETWAESRPLDVLRNHLSALPSLDREANRLDIGEVLDTGELFKIKAFLFHAEQIYIDKPPGVSPRYYAVIRDLRSSIHPEDEPSARFRLSSRLDPELEAARATEKRLRNEVVTLRTQLQDAVVKDRGGRFDLLGRFESDGANPGMDSRLRSSSNGSWVLDSPPLKDLEDKHAQEVEAVERLEFEVRRRLSTHLCTSIQSIRAVLLELVLVDLRLAKIRFRHAISGVWPVRLTTKGPDLGVTKGPAEPTKGPAQGVTKGPAEPARMATETMTRGPWLSLRGARMPGFESPQAIDVDFETTTIVTGPNMGGKSALLKLAGLCQWAAQHMLPVPATTATFRETRGVVYVGSDETAAISTTEGLSSFGREVRRLVETRGDAPRLFLLDEVGRGTHPDDGAAIASRVIRDLERAGHLVIAATHFPAVASLDGAQHMRIAGIRDHEALRQALEGVTDVDAIREVLRESMDYRPLEVDAESAVPRDAWTIAEALGLWAD